MDIAGIKIDLPTVISTFCVIVPPISVLSWKLSQKITHLEELKHKCINELPQRIIEKVTELDKTVGMIEKENHITFHQIETKIAHIELSIETLRKENNENYKLLNDNLSKLTDRLFEIVRK